jgi:hypothetical protein
MLLTTIKRLKILAFLVILGACSDGSDQPAPPPEIPKSEAQLIGARPFTDARLIQFPNILMLVDAINSEAFTTAMTTLSSASTDHAWVLGVETILPFEASGNFSDSSLLNLDEEQAKALLQANSSITGTLVPDNQMIIDMAVSDNPDPFWMINLIDLYDEANYIYGAAILPMLLAYNSFPTLVMDVDVYNSLGLNLCPQEQWEMLDSEAIAQEYSARSAFLNGPRFWVLDSIVSSTPSPAQAVSALFGDIEMRLVAALVAPVERLEESANGETNYRVAKVSRDTVFSFVAGRQLYELYEPNGNHYMLQSFSRVVDKDLQLSELADLGKRLALHEGWRFVTRTLGFPFDLRTVDGLAQVVTDNLNNTYQRVP